MKQSIKKLLSIVLCACMILSSFAAVSAEANGSIVRKWHMDYNGGSRVTYLGLVCSSINSNGGSPTKEGFESGNLIQDQSGNAVGIDGTGAASFKSISYQSKAYMGLLDYEVSGNNVKPNHTYFKSAMMKLNPESCDDTAKNAGLSIYSFHEISGGVRGFMSDAANFKTKLDAYNGESLVPGYDWGGVKDGTVKNTIKTDWVHVTEAVYVAPYDASDDKTLKEDCRDRQGWVIWGQDWNTVRWTGNWELLVDDYIVLEVPNDDMTAQVYPISYNATITSDGKREAGGKLTASATAYDVNPLVTPTLTYQWQKSTDEKNWTDIKGKTGTEYVLTEEDANADNGISIRVVATASSENSGGETVSYSAYSKSFATSTTSKITGAKLDSSSYMVDSKAKIKATFIRESNITKKNYVWQHSDDGTEWETISGETTEEFTVTPETKKFIRGGISITTDEGTSEYTYTEKAKIISADDEYVFYVDGKTDGNGSFESPFATFENARDAARSIREAGINNPVVVYIRGGEYYRENALELTDRDKNITFRNYPGEKVLVTGGKKVATEDIKKVEDETVLNKVIDKAAKDRLYEIDLSDYVDTLAEPYEWSMALVGWDETLFEKQVRVVVNGSGLDKSRWPNTTEAELVTKNMSNPNKGIATFKYTDSSNRAKLWSEESLKHLMVRGHFSSHWTYALLNVNVDPETKTVTTKSNTKENWTNDQGFYFMNLIEEIDMPGESYTDVANKKVYFYGYGDMENPQVYVPTSTNRLVSLLRSKDITFKGIDFAHSKTKLIDGYGMSGLTIDDCSFTHFGARNYLYGDHINVKNCYWYGNAVSMLDVRDFNNGGYTGNAAGIRKLDKSAENVFENNKFNLGNAVKLYSSPGLSTAYAKEMVVKNNEFYNSASVALSIGTSIDTRVTKNYIHDCVQWTGDMGAIYWNTNSGAFGHEISYNFFENNASTYGDGWAQSIFYDDCATGPWIHHNVFNQGSLGTSEGGERYATKGFGGQFATVENNVFIDTPYGSQFQTWYPYEGSDNQQTGWFLNMYGKTKDGNTGSGYTDAVWQGNQVILNNPEIEKYYEGTPWEGYFKYVNNEYYNMVKDLDRNNDSEKLMEIARKYAPIGENVFRNNVMVGGKDSKIGLDPTYKNGREENTFIAPMSDADKLFTDYENGKFKFSSGAVDTIKKSATGFESFELSDIGVQPFDVDGKTKTVGGAYAEAKNAAIKVENGYATPVYTFADADGEGEGRTLVEWYSANKANGDYQIVSYGGTYDLPVSELEGKYLKCVIKVYDQSGVDGIETETEPVLISEKLAAAKAELNTEIETAKQLADSAVVGNEKGQYTEANMKTFKNAITAAEAVANNEESTVDEVKKAKETLIKAVEKFKKAANKSDISQGDTSVDDGNGSTGGTYLPSGGSSSGGGGGSSSGGANATYDASKNNPTTAPDTQEPSGSVNDNVKFKDIIGHWAKDDILAMYEKGIVSGVTENAFEPDRAITRAEFATLVSNMLKLEGGEAVFDDVESGAWYEDFVNAAAKAGIIVGSDGKFRPNDLITREEMAVIVSKVYDYLEKPEISGDVSGFVDADEISDWAIEYVGKAYAAGLISGMEDGIFAPKANTTRAQAASVLARL